MMYEDARGERLRIEALYIAECREHNQQANMNGHETPLALALNAQLAQAYYQEAHADRDARRTSPG